MYNHKSIFIFILSLPILFISFALGFIYRCFCKGFIRGQMYFDEIMVLEMIKQND